MKVVVINPEDAALLGYQAASVLGQVRYWLYKANNGTNRYVVERFGHRWLAHTREQLCQETGLTSSQMRRAIKRLRENGLITVEQHLFHGKNVSHIRPADEGGLAENGAIEIAQDDPPKVDEYSHPGLVPTDQLITDENNLKTIEDCGAQCAPTFSGKEKEENISGNTSGESSTSGKHTTASKVGAAFKNAWHETYPAFLPAFQTKDMGQFKNLVQRCPHDLAAAIVDHSVRNWHDFCSRACSDEGAFNLPSMPRARRIAGVPDYVFDKHTAVGKCAIRNFAHENPEMRRVLSLWVASPQHVRVAETAAFYTDAMPVSRKFQWEHSEALEILGCRADMIMAGCSVEGIEAVLAVTRDSLEDLNACRRRAAGGAKM